MRPETSRTDYQRAWPFFRACISYVFDRRGTCGDSQCALTKLAATLLSDKIVRAGTVVRFVHKLSPAALVAFSTALSCIDPWLRRYDSGEMICWTEQNTLRTKLYALVYFYRCVCRPCNLGICNSLLNVRAKLRGLDNVTSRVAAGKSCEDIAWKNFAPTPNRLSCAGILRETLGHLSKVEGYDVHPLVKISMERYRPRWPLSLALLLPRRLIFVEALKKLRNLRNARSLRVLFQNLTVREKREIKTIIVLHQRGNQLEICYDERIPRKNAVTDFVRDVTSVCICQFCASVLTYVDLKNRPPIKGVYYDNETLRYRCGNCDSRRVFKFPLVDSEAVYRVEQVDLPSVGVCSGKPGCFNLVAVPRGTCGTCYQRDALPC